MRFMLLLSGLALIVSCDLGQAPAVNVDFGLFDTTGVRSNRFHAGDNFVMQFVLINQTGTDQLYHYTEPPVIFEIAMGDSAIATSIDGLAFPQVVNEGSVRAGGTYKASWTAPNSPARNPKIVLPPGAYTARVRHGCFFDTYRVNPTGQVPFTVIP